MIKLNFLIISNNLATQKVECASEKELLRLVRLFRNLYGTPEFISWQFVRESN